MLNGQNHYTPAQYLDAMLTIDPNQPRDRWHEIGRSAIAAGLTIEDIDAWSSTAPNYAGELDVRASFKTVQADGGTGPGFLIKTARASGWTPGTTPSHFQAPSKPPRPPEPPRKPAPGMGASEVWGRCVPATNGHPYLVAKQAAGVPLSDLRMVPQGDALRIAGQSMAGALVVPAYSPDGTMQSLQFIPAPGTGKKVNLPGSSMAGAMFTVGELAPGGVVYIVEGIGQAWACWQATGGAAVVCFGAGNMGKVATALRQNDDAARLVVVPDVGKEKQAQAIAADVGAAVAAMPSGEANNFDANDLAQRDGFDVLQRLLEAATEPPNPEPRYKLLGRDDIAALPPLAWRVRGVLPAVGLAGLYGPSASGKSFLALDMAAAITEGQRWFNCRVEAAPVVYAALEGEAGFKLRCQAWEVHRGRTLPTNLHMVMQEFKLTDPRDVRDLASVVPSGAVVFLDTLNRAAPTADENASKDMGEILQAAKRLQSLTGGLVVLVHHTGKDATKGLRGHSSLFAAMDAAVEVSRDGDRREWKVAKAKDGADGGAHPFTLQVETLGTDAYGDAITSCVVMVDHAPQEIRAKLSGGSNQRLILDALQPLFKTGQSGKAGAPPLRPCIELDAALTIAASRLITVEEKRKPERAKRAIQDLVAKGLLGFNEGWLWLI